MSRSRFGQFEGKGPYIAFGIPRHGGTSCIGGFNTLAEAKRACAREETAPMGRWTNVEDSFGKAYYADSCCEILVGAHKHLKLTPAEIEQATRRFRWRETLR